MYLTNTLKLTNAEAERLTKPQGKEYYPPNYDYEYCKDMWNKAESVMKAQSKESDIGRDIWNKAEQIEIGTMKRDSKRNHIYSKLRRCYKDNLL